MDCRSLGGSPFPCGAVRFFGVSFPLMPGRARSSVRLLLYRRVPALLAARACSSVSLLLFRLVLTLLSACPLFWRLSALSLTPYSHFRKNNSGVAAPLGYRPLLSERDTILHLYPLLPVLLSHALTYGCLYGGALWTCTLPHLPLLWPDHIYYRRSIALYGYATTTTYPVLYIWGDSG